MKWYLIVVLIYISLITNDVEHLLMYLLAICIHISSLGKCLFKYFDHFLIALFFCFIYLFIYFWLRWVFVAAHRLSLVAESGDHSLLQCTGFSLQWPLFVVEHGP